MSAVAGPSNNSSTLRETKRAALAGDLPTNKRKKTAKKASHKPPLGKSLASSDKETREAAVERLLGYLAGNEVEDSDRELQEQDEPQIGEQDVAWDSVKLPKAFREEQMLVLWQGCFYCMYMCDKPLPQQKLANQLAEPMLSLLSNPKLKSPDARRQAALSYFSTFWITIVKEWPMIDKYRTDKYYSLMRTMLCGMFRLLKQTSWDAQCIKAAYDVLTRTGGPLRLSDVKTPISIAYHVIDIYLNELERALTDESATDGDGNAGIATVTQVPLLDLLSPLIGVLASTNNKVHFQRIIANIFDPVFDELNGDEDRTERQYLPSDKAACKKAILEALFKRGAEEDTDDVNRKRLYSYAGKRGYGSD